MVRYPTHVKSVWFQSQHEASRVSSHSEELWYSPSVDDYKYTYLGFNKMLQEKARWELHMNDTFCSEQVLEAAPHKTVAIQHLSSHLTSHPNKTCRALLEKQGQTHKQYSPVDSYTWTHQCWLARKDLNTSALCRHCQEKWLIGMNGESESRESVLSAQLDYIYIYLCIFAFYIFLYTIKKGTYWLINNMGQHGFWCQEIKHVFQLIWWCRFWKWP